MVNALILVNIVPNYDNKGREQSSYGYVINANFVFAVLTLAIRTPYCIISGLTKFILRVMFGVSTTA